MKVQVEKLEKSEVKLTIEVSEEKINSYREKAVKELQGQVKVPGFREGEIPADVLEKHMGEQAFMGHVLDFAISQTYEEAIKQEKLKPIAYPKIQILEQKPLKYEAIIPTLPEVKWKKDVSKLKVKRQKPKVEEAEIKEVLENLKKRSMKWNEADRPAKKGDRVEIDFDGFDEGGAALDGTSSKNHPLVLGEGGMIPGFEDAIEGMKKDEEKEFKVTFPEEYQAKHFQGKEVKFKVKLHKIEESEEVEINDDFVKEITGGNRKNIAELKEEIEEEVGKQKETQETGRLENEFLKSLADYVDIEVPDSLIDRETDLIIEKMKQDLSQRGVKWEDYEKEMKEQGKEMRKELAKTAEQQVLIRLGLETLYENEKTEVSDKEIDAEIEVMMGHYPPEFKTMMAERYKDGSQEKEQLRNMLMLRKLVAAHTE
jgi:trigger factor